MQKLYIKKAQNDKLNIAKVNDWASLFFFLVSGCDGSQPLEVGRVGEMEGGVERVSDGEGEVVLVELGEGSA